jgi:protein gp37
MGVYSKIEWTDATWPVVKGCDYVSPGCANCYAAGLIHRHSKHPNPKISLPLAGLTTERGRWTGKVYLNEPHLEDPLKWQKGRMIFVPSHGDLFHADVPDEFIDRVFAVMASASQHTFQVLTKRVERMAAYMRRVSEHGAAAKDRYVTELRNYHMERLEGYQEGFTLPSSPTAELRFIYDSACRQEASFQRNPKPLGHGFSGGEFHWRKWPLSNVWLGTSVENQATADERIPHLLKVPAAVRFLSVEPLLGPVDLSKWLACNCPGDYPRADGGPHNRWCPMALDAYVPRIAWVIVGGESGPNARPCRIEWIRSIVKQCKAAGVPCFVKQLGSRPVFFENAKQETLSQWPKGVYFETISGRDDDMEEGPTVAVLTDKKGGDWSEWPEDLRVREFPKVGAA